MVPVQVLKWDVGQDTTVMPVIYRMIRRNDFNFPRDVRVLPFLINNDGLMSVLIPEKNKLR